MLNNGATERDVRWYPLDSYIGIIPGVNLNTLHHCYSDVSEEPADIMIHKLPVSQSAVEAGVANHSLRLVRKWYHLICCGF